LLPSATEILFAIGAGDDVVGVTHECDFPEQARALPKLTAAAWPAPDSPVEIDRHVRAAVHSGSSLYRLDSVTLEMLQPDLIVTQELCPVCAVSYEIVDGAVKRLEVCHPERSGRTRIVSLEPRTLGDVVETIALLGDLTGRRDAGRAVADAVAARIAALARPARPALPTLVLEWTDPPMSAGHWIPELVERAGGAPVLADAGTDSRRLDWNAIAAADPAAVIVAPCGLDLEQTQRAIAELREIVQWRSLSAVRSGRVLALDGNAYLSRPGPRLADAAQMIAQWYTDGAEYAG
jgi:iron complex transport system substrate-binding protein